MASQTQTLWGASGTPAVSLPADYEPVRPPGFNVERIVLAKGSRSTPERQRFVERICALYPSAALADCPDVPHNRIGLGAVDPVARQREGKRTLVFGELGNAVRISEETGNTCPNYWHFSVYGYCFYGCAYCYLAGTRGVWHSPTVKIYVNLPEILAEIDRTANRLARPTAFYHGKLQDGLALDSLSAYSTVLVPFFATHTFARQVILTKSDAIGRLLGLGHRGRTTLSWSLNPPGLAAQFETNVPPVEARIEAMRAVARAGYPVRAILMPLIPVAGWEQTYEEFVRELLSRVPIARLTFGGICSYPNAEGLMRRKLGRGNVISRHVAATERGADGRARYARSLRVRMYMHLARVAREVRRDIELALCLEEEAVWKAVDAEASLGRCNCVL
jgi:spore photoproduct lyase